MGKKRFSRLTVNRPREMVPTNLARVTVPPRAGILAAVLGIHLSKALEEDYCQV